MRRIRPAATLQTLVAAIPDNQLRSVLIGVLLDGLSLGADRGSPAPDQAHVDNPSRPELPGDGQGQTAQISARQRHSHDRPETRGTPPARLRQAPRQASVQRRAAKAGAAKIGSATPKPPRGRPRIKPAPAGEPTGNGAHPIGRDKSSAAAGSGLMRSRSLQLRHGIRSLASLASTWRSHRTPFAWGRYRPTSTPRQPRDSSN